VVAEGAYESESVTMFDIFPATVVFCPMADRFHRSDPRNENNGRIFVIRPVPTWFFRVASIVTGHVFGVVLVRAGRSWRGEKEIVRKESADVD
jgi:hypothetical protein